MSKEKKTMVFLKWGAPYMLNISLGYMSIVSTKLFSSFRVSYRSNNLFFYSIWTSNVHGCITLGGTRDTSSLANKTKTLQITSIISEGTICGMWKGIQTKATMQPSILGYSVESRKVLIFSSLTFRKSHYFSELNFFYLILFFIIKNKYVYTVCRSSFRNLYDISNPALWMPATLMS